MEKDWQTAENIRPASPKRIALYVIYDQDGILDGFRAYFLKELRKVTDYICAVVSGTLTDESDRQLRGLADEVYYRDNKGLLAGAWFDGIQHIGWEKLYAYDELLMLNDSFFGPFYPLKDLFDAMEESDADFYGAMKNYEEKSYHEIAGRKLKHGFFRGSICYFYIIKRRLLHSKEFRKYWSHLPEIKEDWDTYFYAEISFYDYVLDHGFRADAYQSDKLKGYFFDNLTHNMERLIRDDQIPFARIRPFCTNMQDQSLSIGYASDPRRALDYIDKHTEYDVNLIWDYILRTKNLTNIWRQLQLEYVVSKYCVEKPFLYDKPIAVILHIYYADQVELLADYCLNFPQKTKFYISTIHKETKERIEDAFSQRRLDYTCRTRRNVGVAMSSLWVEYADVVLGGEYEYICYFHDKKSPYSQFAIQGERFAARCYENLFGTAEIVKNIIQLFEDHPRMGVAGAPLVYHGEYFTTAQRGWSQNYENTVKLAKRLDVHVNIDPAINPVSAYGDMFWFRSAALKKAIGHRLTYDDFDEPYKPDFTMMHAIERMYGFLAQDAGYYYADIMNSDEARSDLVNYQTMLYSVSDILIANGKWPYSFEMMKQIVNYYTCPADGSVAAGPGPSMARIVVKEAIHRHIPAPIWSIMKKVYHMAGGKKWLSR